MPWLHSHAVTTTHLHVTTTLPFNVITTVPFNVTVTFEMSPFGPPRDSDLGWGVSSWGEVDWDRSGEGHPDPVHATQQGRALGPDHDSAPLAGPPCLDRRTQPGALAVWHSTANSVLKTAAAAGPRQRSNMQHGSAGQGGRSAAPAGQGVLVEREAACDRG